ncbi:MAG: hypothetical protein QOH60_739 [Mycobacterium sp.]|jgi:uncharacterized membrane protein YphA (DoxX/SURF4 family)|nr:hypothetical protein [Mycobacterium sp.]
MLVRRIARPLLSAVFISNGIDSLRRPAEAAETARATAEGLQKLPEAAASKIPEDPATLARVTAGVQIGGGLLLAAGKMPRLASAALALTVVPGSLGGHLFWTETDSARKSQQRREFMTDLSLIGGLIIASADTEGRPSLGWRGRRAARRASEAVAGVLPGAASSSGNLLETVGERGREFAEVAGERVSPLLDAALERGAELAELARDRGADFAELARERGADWAETARERGADFAELARERGADLAETARDRSADWAETARKESEKRAKKARKRADKAAKKARKRLDEQLA